jgi:hypothetical protein
LQEQVARARAAELRINANSPAAGKEIRVFLKKCMFEL